ncbi:SIS domain-containing protein [Rickettsiella endosymbiont of Aleochara curtula]|uniref:SIS domain-containing protein n=1 Tax=Rickettsiella endosymbiont of Aleochara curtula TaxID=3077936 RepID=UPI00313B55A7
MFAEKFLTETKLIIDKLNLKHIERIVELLLELRQIKGRLFFLGVGGSAANASHAVNDFRKIVGIEAYAPTDNIAELTARANDEGWNTVFSSWLATSHLSAQDMLFVLSVGGGDLEKNISPNLVTALDYGKQQGSKIVGILGRDGGYTAKLADAYVLIPTVNEYHITPHAEAFQAVIWHLMVAHPKLKATTTKWESVTA